MMKWLATLHMHHFDIVKGSLSETSPIAQAESLINRVTSGETLVEKVSLSTTSFGQGSFTPDILKKLCYLG